MKKLIKPLVCLMLIFAISGTALAQDVSLPIDELQKAMSDFSDDVALAMPFNSTIGLNWSDAYIGQLIDIPPHFGAGFSVGYTTMGIKSIENLLEAAGSDSGVLPSFLRDMGMPIPGYTIEGRIGGFILPFDIGIKFGLLPLEMGDVKIDYLLAGFDIRYKLIDSKLSPVKVSLGFGYNYLNGGIKVGVDDIKFKFQVEDNGYSVGEYTLALNDPSMGLTWGTHCFELKGQISFKLPIITPYFGTGLSVAVSNAGYDFSTQLSVQDNHNQPVEIDNALVQNALNSLGISNVKDSGFGSTSEQTSFNMRLYGGLSINILIIRLDLTVLYNLIDSNYGVTFGGRIQL